MASSPPSPPIPNDSSPPASTHLSTIPLASSLLPSHPSLPPSSSTSRSRQSPTKFLTSLLSSSSPLIPPKPVPPRSNPTPLFTSSSKKHPTHASPPSSSPVQSLKCTTGIPGCGVREPWIARRSVHVNLARAGTAEWSEFVDGLKVEHAVREGEFTPGVVDVVTVLRWDAVDMGGGEVWDEREAEREGWVGCEMGVYEMLHHLPAPLQPRCFTVLVASAFAKPSPSSPFPEPSSFTTVSIPVSISDLNLPTSFYNSGRNITEGDTPFKRKKVVFGYYAAVEVVRKSRKEGRQEEIEWIMATTSDARGILPRVIQTPGIPSAISKDVGLFMDWVEKKRR